MAVPAVLIVVMPQLTLRRTGDSFTPLLFIIPSAVIDVGLNPLLIPASVHFRGVDRLIGRIQAHRELSSRE